MKYYEAEYDMNAPVRRRVEVPANSDYGVAVGLRKNGKKVELDASDAVLRLGAETVSADSTDCGRAVFNLASPAEGGAAMAYVDFNRPGQVLHYYGQKTESTPGGRLKTIAYSAYLSAMTDTPLVGLKPSQVKVFGKHWMTINPEEPAELKEQEIVHATIDGTTWTRMGSSSNVWQNGGGLSAETIDVPLSVAITAPAGTINKTSYVVTKIEIDQQPADATFKLELASEDKGAYFKKDVVDTADFVTKDELSADLTAYATNDSLTAYASQAEAEAAALWGGVSLGRTVWLNSDGTVGSGEFSGAATFGSIPQDVKKIVVGTEVSALGRDALSGKYYLKELVLPETVKVLGDRSLAWTADNSRNGELTCVRLPDSVLTAGVEDSPWYQNSKLDVIDWGNTRTTVPSIVGPNSSFGKALNYVPDELYAAWIASPGWSGNAQKVRRHSELEAPYALSSALAAQTGLSAKTDGGAVGANPPAAITAVKSVYESDWATLSASPDANTLYVVVADQV